jgi:ABC-type multidrug transport system permease subunit
MEQELTHKNEVYDNSKEDTLCSMLHDFYNRNMLSIVILVWTFSIIFIIGAIYCGMQFFQTETTRSQIMYAVIFLCCVQFIGQMKIFAWQTIHKNSIKREIKRLELRLEELKK